MVDAIALPPALQALAGRIVDVDSHEMIPAQQWVEYFGTGVSELADAWIASSVTDKEDKNSSNVPDYAGDVIEITDTIMNVKGTKAPGAVDMARRLEVMDAIGVNRQLMFPTSVGIWAVTLLMHDKYDPNLLSAITGDRAGKAKAWLKCYNAWMVDEAKKSDRIRPVPPLISETIDELMSGAHALVDAGIRAIWLPAGALPGGKSPAHPDLEPFWTLMEERDCVVTLHLGTEGKLLESLKGWRDAPSFEGYRTLAEFSTDPWYLSNMHLAAQNFLQTMVLGGVFVRHPNLRVGVIEVGAYWVGPMMETMDLWYRNLGAFGKRHDALAELPSSYIKSNVKVSVFSFEDIGSYIERYGLEDVICFATDYPHVEGGPDMINAMYKKVEKFGNDVVEKFFVKNGEFLFPD
ncbi:MULTISPECIES: amidohydrolase family protein [Sphingobium]|uniref:amidohydrolase family protein n=1 Tax=Sphingobium sp. MI1205 TaxID=407020 RepID=UPI0007701AAF|nr:amidohydrolase family protein [Sphingobium sp. MI1205]AMK19598.1 amidohydrolase 2 [Sphingobium sp. MI1205]